MGALWNRYAAVTLFNKNSSEAVKYDRLKIIFQIEKNSESNANTAKISIFNLSEKGRALAEQEDGRVLLEVGYQSSIEQLFVGDITRAYISHQGADWVATVECGDGADAIRSVHIDKSYAPGVDLKQVVKDTAQAFVDQGQVVLGSLLGLKSKKAQAGLTLSGDGQTILDGLTEGLDLEWSIQDNTLQVLAKDSHNERQAVLLSPETGLVGSPIAREVDGGQGVEFKALIQPKLIPGGLVQIQSRHVSGTFKLRSAAFAGDTHGNDWYVKGKAVAV